MEADISHLLKCGMEWDLESAGLSHRVQNEPIFSIYSFFPLSFCFLEKVKWFGWSQWGCGMS